MIDQETLFAALSLAPSVTLPAVTAEDAGAGLVVSSEGTWEKGEATTATISVSGTTLSITAGE